MNLHRFDRPAWLLAFALATSGCAFNLPPARAAQSTSGETAPNPVPGSVTVADVQRILAGDKGKSDAEVARQLSGLLLLERMSGATLQSLESSIPGTRSREELIALADASVFLDPSAADVLTQPPPDLTEQRRIIASTVDYLKKVVPKLPDFYANRTTLRFQNVRTTTRKGSKSMSEVSWKILDSSKVVVVYRDGKEAIDSPRKGKRAKYQRTEGLVTRGTFGPILSVILFDSARGSVTWARWERGSAGALAVFHFSVPEDQSHYSVTSQQFRGDDAPSIPGTGYHGELTIDPATGTILRVAVEADLPFGSSIVEGDVMVEYGPVEIGGRTYICPIRSVSISLEASGLNSMVDPYDRSAPIPERTLLNDVVFSEYHLFRAETRILTGDSLTPVP